MDVYVIVSLDVITISRSNISLDISMVLLQLLSKSFTIFTSGAAASANSIIIVC